jgi:triacylglycerol lipase
VTAIVEIPPDQYNANAFNSFNAAASDINLANALAMMWMSQLAYDSDATIGVVAPRWGFSSAKPFSDLKIGPTSFDTCGVLGERADAIVLAFAGTDLGIWETVATDTGIELLPATDTHAGFQAAMDGAQPQIKHAVDLSQQTGKPLWITGHSLGAALAALAAQFADTYSKGATTPKAIYVFGMPRAGGQQFQSTYNTNARLGPVTYRFVNGLDVVPRIPPSQVGYRHVGRMLLCTSGQKFALTTALTPLDTDDPALQPFATLAEAIAKLSAGQILSPPGPGTFGQLFRFVPQPIRDHLPDSYYTALS